MIVYEFKKAICLHRLHGKQSNTVVVVYASSQESNPQVYNAKSRRIHMQRKPIPVNSISQWV